MVKVITSVARMMIVTMKMIANFFQDRAILLISPVTNGRNNTYFSGLAPALSEASEV